jgi:hypothetical protein
MIEDASHYIDYIKNQREMCKCAHTLLLHPQGAPLHSDNTWRNDEMSSDSKQCSEGFSAWCASKLGIQVKNTPSLPHNCVYCNKYVRI